jgi:hypothetical protein
MSYIQSKFKEDLLGMPTLGRPVTTTLYVSPNGDDTDGLSWETAFIQFQGALNVASIDENDKFRYRRGDAVSAEWTSISSSDVIDGTWHHIVGIDNGTGFEVWVDGANG